MKKFTYRVTPHMQTWETIYAKSEAECVRTLRDLWKYSVGFIHIKTRRNAVDDRAYQL